MNLPAALAAACAALNALPGDAPPTVLVTVRADALRRLATHADTQPPPPIDGLAAALWATADTDPR